MSTSLGSFQIGQKPVITATFADVAGGVGVATAATFIVKTPDGTETSTSSPNAAIVNTSSNVWTFTMTTLATSGTYVIRTKTTTGLVAATEYTLYVTASNFATP